MFARIKSIATSAQTWLIGGAVAVAASFLLDYVHVQRVADRALALRQGPPEAVAIEVFDPAVNYGVAREMSVLAQIAFDQPIVVTMDDAGDATPTVLYPLYAQMGRDRTALGVLVQIPAGSGTQIDGRALVDDIRGQGAIGSLVRVTGRKIASDEYRLIVQGAVAAHGGTLAGPFHAIEAFPEGRTAALALPEETPIASLLFWTGVAMGLFALAISLRDVARVVFPWKAVEEDSSAGPATTRRFQPLAPQGEILEETRPANEARAPLRRAIGALFPSR